MKSRIFLYIALLLTSSAYAESPKPKHKYRSDKRVNRYDKLIDENASFRLAPFLPSDQSYTPTTRGWRGHDGRIIKMEWLIAEAKKHGVDVSKEEAQLAKKKGLPTPTPTPKVDKIIN